MISKLKLKLANYTIFLPHVVQITKNKSSLGIESNGNDVLCIVDSKVMTFFQFEIVLE